MAWTNDLVFMVRVLIKDIDAPQTYVDQYIERVIITAAIMVNAEVSFNYNYSYSISDLTINPDPTTNEDNIFMALVPLKAACILTESEFKQALGQGIKVRDGDSAIDTSVSFRGYRDILEMGPCKAYQLLKWSLLAANSNNVGKVVFGPYRSSNGYDYSAIEWYYDQFSASRNIR